MNHKVIAFTGILFMTLLLISCGDEEDDNPFLGTWNVVSVDGETLADTFDEGINVTSNWTFHKDGTWEWITEVESILSFNLSGTYTITGSSYTLTLDGEQTSLFELGEDEQDITGTFQRIGSTLTLNHNDGTVVVLKN